MTCSLTGCSGEKSANDLYKEGLSFLEENKRKEACESLKKAIEKKSDKADYYIAYGMALIENGQAKESIAQFDHAILEKKNQIVYNNNKKAFRGKGIAYYRLGQFEEAIKQFKMALDMDGLNDLNEDIKRYLGECYVLNKQYKEAAKLYGELIEETKDSNLYTKRAHAYELAKEYEAAEKDYDEAIKKDSKNYDRYISKFQFYERQGLEAEAKKVLSDALLIEAKTDKDQYKVAQIYYYQGNDTECLKKLEAVKESYRDAYYLEGEIYYKQNQYEQAVHSYEQYLKQADSVAAGLYNQIVFCYMKMEDYQKALEYVKEGMKMCSPEEIKLLRYHEVICYENRAEFQTAYEKANAYVADYGPNEEMEREIKFLKTRL